MVATTVVAVEIATEVAATVVRAADVVTLVVAEIEMIAVAAQIPE